MSESVKPDTKPKTKPKKEETERRPEGRPSKYKPEYCEMLIEHMEKGFSFMSFAGKVRVSFETVYEWDRVHPEFSEAKRIGHGLQLQYDENLLNELSKGEHGKSASSATHIFKMKNCHKWRDKVEIEQTTKTIQINIDKDDESL